MPSITASSSNRSNEMDVLLIVLLPAGVDPKSVLCAFFKQGQCTKGDKCKFSHDLTLERKCEKRSLYVDERDDDLEKGGCRPYPSSFFLLLRIRVFKGSLGHPVS